MLDWFANLWEIEKGEYWGYITTGGTEGNLHGILVGSVFFLNLISRVSILLFQKFILNLNIDLYMLTYTYRREQFPDGVLYTSQDSHYSIFKIARMYRMQCEKVGTLVSGEIDCADLKALLLAHKDKPAIINLNIGLGLVFDSYVVLQLASLCTHVVYKMY